MPYLGKQKVLFQYLDTLEKSDRFDRIVIHSPDIKTLYQDLKSICKWVPAAGGLITNELNQILLIFRKQMWDLPKGKIDEGESTNQAALRECMEETGIQDLKLENKIYTTWHIYREKNGERALKKTKWYKMSCSKNVPIVPQKEEGIDRCEWFDASDALLLSPMYSNIKAIILQYHQE